MQLKLAKTSKITQYVPYHFVHVECRQGHFVPFSLGVQKDQPKLKMEHSKKLILFSVLVELVENKWFRNPPKTRFFLSCVYG